MNTSINTIDTPEVHTKSIFLIIIRLSNGYCSYIGSLDLWYDGKYVYYAFEHEPQRLRPSGGHRDAQPPLSKKPKMYFCKIQCDPQKTIFKVGPFSCFVHILLSTQKFFVKFFPQELFWGRKTFCLGKKCLSPRSKKVFSKKFWNVFHAL